MYKIFIVFTFNCLSLSFSAINPPSKNILLKGKIQASSETGNKKGTVNEEVSLGVIQNWLNELIQEKEKRPDSDFEIVPVEGLDDEVLFNSEIRCVEARTPRRLQLSAFYPKGLLNRTVYDQEVHRSRSLDLDLGQEGEIGNKDVQLCDEIRRKEGEQSEVIGDSEIATAAIS